MPIASGAFVARGVAQFAQFFEFGLCTATADTKSARTQECPWCNAHRQVVRRVFRKFVGNVACPTQAGMRSNYVTVCRPCGGAHVPRVGTQ